MTPYVPDAHAGGGSNHEFQLLRHAAQVHDVHVITGGLPGGRVELDLDGVTVAADGVLWRARRGPSNAVATGVRTVLTGPSLTFWALRDRAARMRQALADRVSAHPPDLVHVTMGEIAPIVSAVSTPTALLLFDIYSRHLEREATHSDRLRRRLLWSVQAAKTRRWEARWYRRPTVVACVSSCDAAAAWKLTRRPVDVVENPVAEAFFDPPSKPRSPMKVTFVANLDYRPNVDAVAWFTSAIWPIVVKRCPTAELHVVGANPREFVRRTIAAAGGTLHANVDDVRPYYWSAAVAVAPVRLGSGLRNKALHAMACGAPVVATPAALEGTGAIDAVHASVASGEREFADAVLKTLADPAAAAIRARRARELVSRLRAERVFARFDEWWSGAIRR